MSLFSKVDPVTLLDTLLLEYKEMMNDRNYLLSYVFRFHENNGQDYIYRENTTRRDVFLLRNNTRIAIRHIDASGKELFYAERAISIKNDSEMKIARIIHDLYVEELQ